MRTALEENRNKLSCDFLYATHKNNYVWYRETGYVLRWAENDSIHIVICRQNIDKEKGSSGFSVGNPCQELAG